MARKVMLFFLCGRVFHTDSRLLLCEPGAGIDATLCTYSWSPLPSRRRRNRAYR